MGGASDPPPGVLSCDGFGMGDEMTCAAGDETGEIVCGADNETGLMACGAGATVFLGGVSSFF